jgi:succinate-semialdehyde dehydrogenase/glutarate-semialdehyde dehydrogenase
MKSINPYNNDVISSYDKMSDSEVLSHIENCQRGFNQWKVADFEERSRLIKNASVILKDNIEKYAAIITEEMGKPITESKSEVEKCAWVCDYYAENAEEFLKPQKVDNDSNKSYVRFDPIGIVFAVMPWNFPFWQVFRFAAPTLMAGNVGMLKHASNVSGCAFLIEQVFTEAGFPKDVFKTLIIDQAQVANVIEHENIRAVTITGSVAAGKAVAAKAGEFCKKSVLELGGSDAYIVLKDADIDKAAELCVKSRMINGGQSCIAAKRFIVQESVHDEFVEKVKIHMESYKYGDPMKPDTKLGSLVSKEQREQVHKQVSLSTEKGAKCILGGEITDEEGAAYPASILINVKKGMPAYDEEIFGPVASIIKVKDVEEAISIANDSEFGLGGAVFTQDMDLAEKVAYMMDTGNVAINDFVKSNPRLPFGGVKSSGYGRELADFGIREFVNIKTVVFG